MKADVSYIEALRAAAHQRTAAEDEFRRTIATRLKELEQERAFSYRRFNLINEVSGAVASAESEEIAVAVATAVLRARLGWVSDSDARVAVTSGFAPVAQAMFANRAVESEDEPKPDVLAALAAFEAWYLATHPAPFWKLFENVMPETPVVDF
jgi:hypothetical protein